jgi:hypothetical protein
MKDNQKLKKISRQMTDITCLEIEVDESNSTEKEGAFPLPQPTSPLLLAPKPPGLEEKCTDHSFSITVAPSKDPISISTVH